MRKLKFTSLIVLISFYFYSINSHAQSLGAEIEAIADIIVDIEGSGDYTSVEEGLRRCLIPVISGQWFM